MIHIHLPFESGKVTDIKGQSIIVSRFGGSYRLLTKEHFVIGDTISFEGVSLKEERDQYSIMYRIFKTYKDVKIDKIKSSNSIKGKIYLKYPHLFNTNDSDMATVGMRLAGILILVDLVLGPILLNKSRTNIKLFLLIGYRICFGWSLYWLRYLMKILKVSVETQMTIILLIFPKSFLSLAFLFPYGFYIFKSILPHLKKYQFYIMLSLEYLGYYNPLEFLLLPVNRIISIFLPQLQITFPRLTLYGKVPILWALVIYMFHRSIKTQGILILVTALVMVYPPYAQVIFFNVGQGDASLIQMPFDAHSILVDTGRKFSYRDLKYGLHSFGVGQIDSLLITHDDLDHMENKEAIMKDFRVKNLIEGKPWEESFVEAFLNDIEYDDPNGNSLVLGFKLYGQSFLMTGDGGVEQERDLHAIGRYNILKCGHHGSKTSTSEDFIRYVRPDYCIISSNPKTYGHPHSETLRALHKGQVTVLETSKSGHIRFIITPFFTFFITSKREFGIIEPVIQ